MKQICRNIENGIPQPTEDQKRMAKKYNCLGITMRMKSIKDEQGNSWAREAKFDLEGNFQGVELWKSEKLVEVEILTEKEWEDELKDKIQELEEKIEKEEEKEYANWIQIEKWEEEKYSIEQYLKGKEK